MAFDSLKADLKAVGAAIKNSPKAMRKKLGIDSSAHAQRLDEDWYHSDDPINAGVTFYVKYLGSAEVTKTHGPGSTDDAVRQIVHHAKARGGKLQKVEMTVSSRSMKLIDIQQNMKLEEIPLYRVSYCTVDPYYDKVFCYISRNHETKLLECHAFLCSKKSKAEAITLTVAQAFNIAFERWQTHKKKKAAAIEKAKGEASAGATNGGRGGGATEARTDSIDGSIGKELTAPQKDPTLKTTPTPPRQTTPTRSPETTPTPPAIQPPPPQSHNRRDLSPLHSATKAVGDMSIGVTPASPTEKTSARKATGGANPFAADDSSVNKNSTDLLDIKPTMSKAVSLDHLQMDDLFDMEFTALADSRSNPHLLAIGDHMNRTGMHDEVMDMMKGEESPIDLAKSKSIDDLLLL